MRIFTHGNKAHVDDMLACAILVAVNPYDSLEIVRVNNDRDLPTLPPGDCDFIVDVGGRYDAEQRCFDHHQNDEAVKGECAATLIARHYCPCLLEDSVWGPFLRRVALQDNIGMWAVESEKGGSRIADLLVMEWGIVSWFEKDPCSAATAVAAMIRDRLYYLKEVEEASSWVSRNAAVVSVGKVKALVLHHDPREDGVNPAAVNTATGVILDREGIHASVSFDPRSGIGEVRSVFRTRNGEGMLDFTFSSPSSPVFCHKAGFLLNFIPKDEREWEKVLSDAIVG